MAIAILIAFLVGSAIAGSQFHLPRFCTLPPDTGPCEAAIPRWFFNHKKGVCAQFIYGGCGGNRNRFTSKDACESQCVIDTSICTLPPETGPCKAAIPRWFFNHKKSVCAQFIYGGCDGNGNRFISKDACEAQCSSNLVVDKPRVCSINADMVCIMDASGTPDQFEKLKLTFVEVVRSQRFDFTESRFAAVSMTGSVPTVGYYLDEYTTAEDAMDALIRVPYRTGPHMGKEGLEFLEQKIFSEIKGDRPDKDDVIFYLAGSRSITDMSQEAESLRRSGARIWAIGVELTGAEGAIARRQLKDITGNETRYIEASSFDELTTKGFANKLNNLICPQL